MRRYHLSKVCTKTVQAIRNHSVAARSLLPRVLMMLSFEDASGCVARAIEGAADIPHAVWLPHLSSLLTSLQRSERRTARRVLHQIAKHFPQVTD